MGVTTGLKAVGMEDMDCCNEASAALRTESAFKSAEFAEALGLAGAAVAEVCEMAVVTGMTTGTRVVDNATSALFRKLNVRTEVRWYNLPAVVARTLFALDAMPMTTELALDNALEMIAGTGVTVRTVAVVD